MPTPERSPRRIAVDILTRIEQRGEFAEPLLDVALSDDTLGDIHDRRLLTELVYGSLRMRGRLDWIIGRLLRGRLASLKPDLRNILRTAFRIMPSSMRPSACPRPSIRLARNL
jgi:16S rRNA (cytosine967-C5)-methyltransferase